MSQNRYLIIGGTTKAATTSLFHYLADHPEVTAATIKETRFFIDQNYPVQPPVATGWWEGIEKFETFFADQGQYLRLDATPDYLYSEGTPQRLKAFLPDVKVVFILRDPITRIASWYKFAKQINHIPSAMTFREYVDEQLMGGHFEQAKQQRQDGLCGPSPAYFLSALEHGRYSHYLQSYINILGADRVKTYFYEELCTDPMKVLQDLCHFTALTASFYDHYKFQVFNRSVSVKSARLNHLYSRLRWQIRRRTHNLPIHSTFRQMRLWFDPIYYRLNSQADETVEIHPDIRARLEAYYEPDVVLLEQMLGCPIPWSVKPEKTRSN